MKKIATLITLTITAGLLVAQPGMPKGPGGQYGERMEMMMIWKLTDYLELTEDQAEKLFPKIRAHQKEVRKLRQSEMEFWKPLKVKMEKGKSLSDKDMEKVINHIASMDTKKSKARIDFVKGTDSFLSPTQQVKLLTFEGMMRKETQQRIKDRYRPGPQGNKQKRKRRF